MSDQFKHTMLDPQFGKLVPKDFPDERDAIHIATAAVYALENLNPGDHVGLISERADAMGKSEIAPLGIVDPFLTTPVKEGERFWVFLYPGSIRSLRHNWSHAAFDNRAALVNALRESPNRKRMQAFANSLQDDDDGNPVTVEELIKRAKLYIACGEDWCEGGRFEGDYIYRDFWTDFEVLTGISVPSDKRYNFFSCSC